MNYVDAHVHVWTDDVGHYPLGKGWKKEDMKPSTFTPRTCSSTPRPPASIASTSSR